MILAVSTGQSAVLGCGREIQGKHSGGTMHLALLFMTSRMSKHKCGMTWEQTWWKDERTALAFWSARVRGTIWKLGFRQHFEI